MSRRRFIKGAGAAFAATALVNAPAVHAKKVYRWKMVTAWPPNFPIFQEGAERFARDIRNITGGRLDINPCKPSMPFPRARYKWDTERPITGPEKYRQHNFSPLSRLV